MIKISSNLSPYPNTPPPKYTFHIISNPSISTHQNNTSSLSRTHLSSPLLPSPSITHLQQSPQLHPHPLFSSSSKHAIHPIIKKQAHLSLFLPIPSNTNLPFKYQIIQSRHQNLKNQFHQTLTLTLRPLSHRTGGFSHIPVVSSPSAPGRRPAEPPKVPYQYRGSLPHSRSVETLP